MDRKSPLLLQETGHRSALEPVCRDVQTLVGQTALSLTTYVSVYRRTGTGDVFAFRWWFETGKATADDVYDPTSPVTWLRSFGRRDTYVFVWMVALVAGLPWWIVCHGALIAAVNVSLLVLHFTVFRQRR